MMKMYTQAALAWASLAGYLTGTRKEALHYLQSLTLHLFHQKLYASACSGVCHMVGKEITLSIS